MAQQKENPGNKNDQDHIRKIELVVWAINEIYCNFFPDAPVIPLPQQLNTLLDLSKQLKNIRDNLHLLQPSQSPKQEHPIHSEQCFHNNTSYQTGRLLIDLKDPNIMHLLGNWMNILQEWILSDMIIKQNLSVNQIVIMTTIAHEELGKGIERAMRLMGIEIIGKVDHNEKGEMNDNANN